MAGYFFGCPHCRAKLEARDASRAGRTVTCPQCQQALIIPPPPPMGLSLAQSEGASPTTEIDPSTQFVVSSDPGFKRAMSPAKAFGEGTDTAPAAPSHSAPEKLPAAESLQAADSNTLAASDDIEGYSFTVPDVDTDVARPPAFVFKPKKKRSEAEEAPHPFEDPKNQLLALVGVVLVIVVIGAVWSWLSGDGKDKDKPAESSTEAPSVEPSAPFPPIAPPSQPDVTPEGSGTAPDPGAAPLPGNPNPLPDAPVPAPTPGTPESAPVPPEPSSELPGAVPNVLPGGDSERKPGTAPRSLPESTPNVLPGAQP